MLTNFFKPFNPQALDRNIQLMIGIHLDEMCATSLKHVDFKRLRSTNLGGYLFALHTI